MEKNPTEFGYIKYELDERVEFCLVAPERGGGRFGFFSALSKAGGGFFNPIK